MNNPDYGASEYTPLKTLHHRKILRSLVGPASVVIRREKWPARRYRYFDLTAGPGMVGNDPQSPVCAVEVLTAAVSTDGPNSLPSFRADFCEWNPGTYNRLENALAGFRVPDGCDLAIHHDDGLAVFDLLAASIPTNTLGLVYFDPKKVSAIFDAAESLSRTLAKPQCSRIDILLYVSATDVKRVFGAGFSDETLPGIVKRFNKKEWFIRETFGSQRQWTFLFGTNYTDFHTKRSVRLFPISKPDGRALFDRLCRTGCQRAEQPRQLELFGGAK